MAVLECRRRARAPRFRRETACRIRDDATGTCRKVRKATRQQCPGSGGGLSAGWPISPRSHAAASSFPAASPGALNSAEPQI